MSNQPYIPQFKLQDEAGKAVSFRYMLLGNKAQNYDFEKPHRHNFNEVLLFYKGGGTHDIDFTTSEIKSHSIHFVASDNVHLVLLAKDASGCNLLFDNDYIVKELISQLPFSKTNPTLNLNDTDFKLIIELVECIKREYNNKQEGYQNIIQAYMQAFMLHLMRVYHNQYPELVEKSTKPELINRFMELLKQYYINHFTVEQYADKLNISAKHLIDICKTHTGKSPLQHIKEYTIAEAKKILFHTQLSVKEIAYQLGFDDPANFSRYFKSVTTYTPVEYREGIGK